MLKVEIFPRFSTAIRCSKGSVIPTFITSSGLVRNSYAEELAVREITLDDLFWQ